MLLFSLLNLATSLGSQFNSNPKEVISSQVVMMAATLHNSLWSRAVWRKKLKIEIFMRLNNSFGIMAYRIIKPAMTHEMAALCALRMINPNYYYIDFVYDC